MQCFLLIIGCFFFSFSFFRNESVTKLFISYIAQIGGGNEHEHRNIRITSDSLMQKRREHISFERGLDSE